MFACTSTEHSFGGADRRGATRMCDTSTRADSGWTDVHKCNGVEDVPSTRAMTRLVPQPELDVARYRSVPSMRCGQSDLGRSTRTCLSGVIQALRPMLEAE